MYRKLVLKRVEKGKFLSERVCSYKRLLTNEKQHSDQDLPIGSKPNFICFRYNFMLFFELPKIQGIAPIAPLTLRPLGNMMAEANTMMKQMQG